MFMNATTIKASNTKLDSITLLFVSICFKMNIVKKYLIATRSFFNITCFVFLLEGIIVSYVQTQSIHLGKLVLVFLLSVLTHNMSYLANSLIDFCTGSDVAETSNDRTLFELITFKELYLFLVFISCLICSLLFIVYNVFSVIEFYQFLYFVIFQVICAWIYTPLKYFAMGHIIFSGFFMSVYFWAIFVCTGSFPVWGPEVKYSLLTPILLTLAIHGNYIRDYDADKKAKIYTTATIFKKKKCNIS
ncbi:hypothetical protein CYY_009387 [Polysphondylium violaceum]|uniref:UbiA prenyltransferase family protein n=1 Tax=Polysphondylium violaceum TaxID=133409 RepID=A0A8J4PTR3_9MYCE|nr:hypothetical protein CYY_009387 [Polysphondylium violaceum]